MRQPIRCMVMALLLAGLAPAPASALGIPGSPPPPTSAPAVTPKPVGGSLKLHLSGLFVVHGDLVTVRGRGLTVVGLVRPYVPGQWVTVRASIGRHAIKRRRVQIKPTKNRGVGRFELRFSSSRVGRVRVTVIHARSARQHAFKAHRSFIVLDRRAGFGSTGRLVQLIQQRLSALRFYLRQSGVYDGSTALAIDAYHRLLGWGTYKTLDSRTVSFLLNGWGQFKVRYPRHGRHAEGNLGKQLLALVNGGQVYAIYPISSGKPSTPTILGDFRIYRRDPGMAPDGMFYSSYFYTGYAIHGYNPAPDYPASHGCMRLPMSDAIPVYNWLNYGDWVDVYY